MNKNESKYFNTAKKMGNSLLTLIEKKDFSYISVKEICALAQVNRSTFYLHYETTYDLLQEVIEDLNASFNHFFDQTNPVDVTKEQLQNLNFITDDYLIPYLEFVKKNKKVYKIAKNHPKLFKVNDTYESFYEKLFSPILSRYHVPEKEAKYILHFYINGIISIVMTWIEDDCIDSVEMILKLIKNCVNGGKLED